MALDLQLLEVYRRMICLELNCQVMSYHVGAEIYVPIANILWCPVTKLPH